MTPLLVALLLSSNGSGKTLVRTNPGTTVPVSGVSGPLILDDANTVAHVTWNGAALVDSKGGAWTMNGTVPQVQKSGKTPAGAGPYTTSNYYSLPVSNPSNVTGTISACFVFTAAGTNPTGVVYSVGQGTAATGWIAQVQATNWRLMSNNVSVATANAAVLNAVNVGCVGVSGTNGYAKLNLGTIATATGADLTASANATNLGRYQPGSLAFPSTVIEAWVTTTAPSDALFISVMQRVKARAGVTAW